MSKQITIFLLLLLCVSMYSQNSDPALNLDDILILGKARAIADSIQPLEDNLEITRYLSTKDLNYYPETLDVHIKEIITTSKYKKNYIHISGGNNSWILGKLLYQYKDFDILARFFNYSTGNEYKLQEIEFSLKSSYKSTPYYFNFQNLNYENKIMKNEANRFQASIPHITLDYSRYVPSEVDFMISLNSYKLHADTQTTISDHDKTELELKTGLLWDLDSFEPFLNMNYAASNISSDFGINLHNNYLKKYATALWFAVDKKRNIPSIRYSTEINLDKMIFILNNDPQLIPFSRYDVLQNNQFLGDTFKFQPEKSPVNHNFIIQNENLPLSIYWNSRFTYDKIIAFNILPDQAENHIHEVITDDVWINTAGVFFKTKWDSFTFSEKAQYVAYSKDVYHLPSFENTAKLMWHKSAFQSDIALNYSTGSMSINNYFEDVVMLNYQIRYKYGNLLTAMLSIDNILDKDYRHIFLRYLPGNSGITLRGGVTLHF